MWSIFLNLCFVIFLYVIDSPARGILLVIPEDVATGFAAIYGFSPRLLKGSDHRLGFGFRFGNHADLQVLYELGPQLSTNTIRPPKTRSSQHRQRVTRRRPVLEFLLRTGFLKEAPYKTNYNVNECVEPR